MIRESCGLQSVGKAYAKRMARLGLTLILLGGSASAQSPETQLALEELTMIHCLAGTVREDAYDTDFLFPLASADAAQLLGTHEGETFFGRSRKVLLNLPGDGSCSVYSFEAAVGDVQAFGAEWFGTGRTPFELVEAVGDPDETMTAAYRGTDGNFDGVRVLVRTEADASVAVVTIVRDK